MNSHVPGSSPIPGAGSHGHDGAGGAKNLRQRSNYQPPRNIGEVSSNSGRHTADDDTFYIKFSVIRIPIASLVVPRLETSTINMSDNV